MKFKRIIPIALVLAAVAGGWFWLQHRRTPLSEISVETIRPVRPDTARRELSQLAGTPARAVGSPALRASLLGDASPVQMIVDPQQDYLRRCAALSVISTNLSPGDWVAIQGFLLRKDLMDEDQPGQVLKNRLLDALCELNPPPAALGDLLTQIYRDRNQDEVIRDYAVQHLAVFYEQLELATGDAGALRNIQDLLWEALGETESSIAGTALLGLERLSRERAEFDRKQIAAAAWRLAAEGKAGELARITAFQICGRMGINEAGAVLREAALNGKTMPLRISAIGALGVLGDVQARSLLTGVVNGQEERLRLPAQEALFEIQRQEEQKMNKPEI